MGLPSKVQPVTATMTKWYSSKHMICACTKSFHQGQTDLCIPYLNRTAVLCNSCADWVMIGWAAHSRTRQYIPAGKISYSVELSPTPGHAHVLIYSLFFPLHLQVLSGPHAFWLCPLLYLQVSVPAPSIRWDQLPQSCCSTQSSLQYTLSLLSSSASWLSSSVEGIYSLLH